MIASLKKRKKRYCNLVVKIPARANLFDHLLRYQVQKAKTWLDMYQLYIPYVRCS